MSPVSVEQIHDSSLPVYDRMESLIRWKQKQITDAIEKIDSNPFRIDDWKREDGHGGGVTMVLQDANVFEKGGVNISVIDSKLTAQGVERMRVNHNNLQAAEDGTVKFRVCGLSLVIHPRNPHAPTVHANYRYFETLHPQTGKTQSWWFGGGADLTPSYLYEEDAKLFHASHKKALDKYDEDLYPNWKKWCDEYFVIKHRGEARGVGGIFFDDFDSKSPDVTLKIIESCFDAFIDSYVEIVNRRKDTPFTEDQKQWQQLRRGRYVEFNLVNDRGTQFGLQTPGARIESILMTLPLTASWLYDHNPEEGSEEHKLLSILKSPVDWV